MRHEHAWHHEEEEGDEPQFGPGGERWRRAAGEDIWWARGGRRGHGRGPRPGMRRPGFGFGPPGPGPGPWFWFAEPRLMRRSRARRGDVRAAALALLAEQPMNGYQIIQAIGERSNGLWRPSPGSVYPSLQQLEDEGLIRAEAGEGGRRGYALTDEGRAYVQAHPDEVNAPWEVVTGPLGGAVIEIRSLIAQVAAATMQVLHAGSEGQVTQAQRVLTEARKALYRILAEDSAESPAAPAGSAESDEQ
jgi:DNA-binding PadR family transcriptional regulator